MYNYNAKEDLQNNYEQYKETYDLNLEYICDNGGDTLSEQEKNILIAGYLGNMHETLSTVSSNLCQLSKSTYDAQVYIDEIRDYQQRVNEEIIKDDILMLLGEDVSETEKIELIREYVNELGE